MTEARLGQAARAVSITSWLLAGLVLLGVVLRVHEVGEPQYFTFDEENFAVNAHRYLLYAADLNDHPPVGKLLIAVGLLLFGNTGLGWRFIPLVFGLHQLVIGYWLGSRLFESRRAGWMAAAFLAADGFFISYSRACLMDGILTCIVLWSMLAAVTARSTWGVLVSVLLSGIAMTVKWSGAFSIFPAAAAVLALGRAPKAAVLTYVFVPVIHVLIWMGALHLTHERADIVSFWHVAKGLFLHHVEMGHRDNGLASPWYTWLFLKHPIVTKLSPHGFGQRYSSSAGNVVSWAAGTLLVLTVPLFRLFLAVRRLFARAKTKPIGPYFKPALLLALGWFSLLFPWMVGRGKYTFSYHYLPSYGFAVVLVAGTIAELERRRPALSLAFVTAVTAVALYFAPVWGESIMTDAAANRRLIFVPWRP